MSTMCRVLISNLYIFEVPRNKVYLAPPCEEAKSRPPNRVHRWHRHGPGVPLPTNLLFIICQITVLQCQCATRATNGRLQQRNKGLQPFSQWAWSRPVYLAKRRMPPHSTGGAKTTADSCAGTGKPEAKLGMEGKAALS